MVEDGFGEVEDGADDFLVVEVGHDLVGAEFGFVGRGDTVKAFIVVQLDERDKRCYSSDVSATNLNA